MVWIDAFHARTVAAWTRLESASARTQLYILGGCIMLLSAGVMLLPITRPLSLPMIIVGAAFMAAAVVIECYFVTLWALETPVGKLVGMLTVAAVVPVALGLSSNIVGGATGQSPADLPYAVGLIAPLTAGYFVVLASAIVMFVGMLLGMVVWMFALALGRKEQTNRDALKVAARLIGIIGLFSLVNAGWREGAPTYEGGLRWMARTAAYALDTYPSQECGVDATRKIKRINDDVVISARVLDNEVRFTRTRCPLIKSSEPAPLLGATVD